MAAKINNGPREHWWNLYFFILHICGILQETILSHCDIMDRSRFVIYLPNNNRTVISIQAGTGTTVSSGGKHNQNFVNHQTSQYPISGLHNLTCMHIFRFIRHWTIWFIWKSITLMVYLRIHVVNLRNMYVVLHYEGCERITKPFLQAGWNEKLFKKINCSIHCCIFYCWKSNCYCVNNKIFHRNKQDILLRSWLVEYYGL